MKTNQIVSVLFGNPIHAPSSALTARRFQGVADAAIKGFVNRAWRTNLWHSNGPIARTYTNVNIPRVGRKILWNCLETRTHLDDRQCVKLICNWEGEATPVNIFALTNRLRNELLAISDKCPILFSYQHADQAIET